MEVLLPDSAISDQDATAAAGAGLDAGGQEAGRVNGLMSTLGMRTSERDDAIAERAPDDPRQHRSRRRGWSTVAMRSRTAARNCVDAGQSSPNSKANTGVP